MVYALKIGNLALPDTFSARKVPMNRNVPSAKTARTDGARTLAGYLEARKFSVKGGLVGDSMPINTGGSLRDQLDELKAACTSGYTTFQTEDDRVWRNCQVDSYSDDYDESGFSHFCEVSFDVITGDPFSYEVAAQSVTQAVGGGGATINVVPGGNAYVLPQIRLTVNATGTLSALLTNPATGDVFSLNGAVTAGDVIQVDCAAEKVTRVADGADRMPLFDGLFPRLLVGANALSLIVSTGSLSQAVVAWNNRWY